MSAPGGDFPDALVGPGPARLDDVDDLGEELPQSAVDGAAVAVVEPDGVEELPVDVELELAGGGVAHTDRPRTANRGSRPGRPTRPRAPVARRPRRRAAGAGRPAP